jgi:DNA topoisomerase-1
MHPLSLSLSLIHSLSYTLSHTLSHSKDKRSKQIATAMWLIDILALRVGGEKGEDEADTVGCCSLRVEHMTFNADPSISEMELEFLGKDSMLFKQVRLEARRLGSVEKKSLAEKSALKFG